MQTLLAFLSSTTSIIAYPRTIKWKFRPVVNAPFLKISVTLIKLFIPLKNSIENRKSTVQFMPFQFHVLRPSDIFALFIFIRLFCRYEHVYFVYLLDLFWLFTCCILRFFYRHTRVTFVYLLSFGGISNLYYLLIFF